MDILGRDNIVAEITPVGKGAVSGLRLSGKDARLIAEKIFNTKIKRTRTAYFLRTDIDDIILIYYKAPASYTGEDVCEIFCHGNPLIVGNIIDKIISLKDHKTRLAGPGEFTKRAYLNNKMDLVQAETVAEIINTTNAMSLKMRNRILKGDLSSKLYKIKDKLLSISSLIELEIDFEEEKASVFNEEKIIKELKELVADTGSILSSSSRMEILAKDIMVAIVGDTNVGKSSLFNSLIGKQRSIVHHIPGTTRDYIEATINMGSFSVLFVDTAGFRTDTVSEVELEGIKKVSDLSDTAIFIIEVFDSEAHVFKYNTALKVRNKVDIKRPEKLSSGVFYVSAKTGEGIKELKEIILKKLLSDFSLSDDKAHEFILSKRQTQLLKELNNDLLRITASIEQGDPIDAVSYLLRQVLLLINIILGKEENNDETIEEVFSRFCIGK